MSDYIKLRQKNIAERNAILADLFKEFKNPDKTESTESEKPKKRRGRPLKRPTSDIEDEVEIEPSKKQKRVIKKVWVRERRYNTRAKVAKRGIVESGESGDDSDYSAASSHRSPIHTRSWRDDQKPRIIGMMTRNQLKIGKEGDGSQIETKKYEEDEIDRRVLSTDSE